MADVFFDKTLPSNLEQLYGAPPISLTAESMRNCERNMRAGKQVDISVAAGTVSFRITTPEFTREVILAGPSGYPGVAYAAITANELSNTVRTANRACLDNVAVFAAVDMPLLFAAPLDSGRFALLLQAVNTAKKCLVL
jgi:hypothetical protein